MASVDDPAGTASVIGPHAPRREDLQEEPSIDVLLDVDREYREKLALDLPPRIAPKRFIPASKSWLPVLLTTRAPWHFTAARSNTSRAHDLGRIWD